jgi:hypothetical protein
MVSVWLYCRAFCDLFDAKLPTSVPQSLQSCRSWPAFSLVPNGV